MATHEDVRKICSGLPGAAEGEGRFGFGVRGKGFCWTWMERVHSKKARVENPGVLAVLTPGLGAKEVLMGAEPAKYAVDPHYDGYPAVLVRLDAVDVGRLEELLTEAWRTKATREGLAQFERDAP